MKAYQLLYLHPFLYDHSCLRFKTKKIDMRRIFHIEMYKKKSVEMCQKYRVGRRKARAGIVFSWCKRERSEQCRRAATFYNFMHFPLLLGGGLGEWASKVVGVSRRQNCFQCRVARGNFGFWARGEWGKVKAEREGAGVQGHALSQIINFSSLGDPKRIYASLKDEFLVRAHCVRW